MATPGFSPLTIILNKASGWDAKAEDSERLRAILPAAEVVPVERGADITGLARRAVHQGARTIVAGGGDGTIRAVAEAVAGTPAVLGLLPGGTINHFARNLNIPLEREAAARVVLTGRVIEVDAGEVNGRIFVNNSTIGLYPAYRFRRQDRERRGWNRVLAVVAASMDIVRRYPFLVVRFQGDGKDLVRRTPFVMVANNEHRMEGYQLGTRPRLDEGRLWVYLMRPGGRLRLLRILLEVLLGRFSKWRELEFFSAAEVRIETPRRRLGVALDGEVVLMDTPLHYRSRPRALRVIVPR